MTDARELQSRFDAQRQAFAAEPYPSLAKRRDRLARLATLTRRHRDEIVRAIAADYGHRAAAETQLAEIATVGQAVRHARRHLRRWMRPRRAAVPWRLLPARARIHYQPLGVVGIMAPSNYPWNLAWLPAVDALAAGNRVLIKPSEHTPVTSALMARLAEYYFAPDELAVITGEVETAQAFAALPFDHLLFTGSARVGREVARAAAANLTPTTLELGGKSPVIVGADADLARAAERIAFGKWLNAGQTCIAPDHVLIDTSRLTAFIEAMRKTVNDFYPRGTAGEDYSAVLGDRQRERLEAMLAEARDHGCRVIELGERVTLADGGTKLPPTLVINPHHALSLMREEIFGPWLPVIGLGDFDAALARVNAGPRPLALYAFTDDAVERRRLLEQTHSGGVVFNDTLLHSAVPALPFGGVGESGMGAYHGESGFRRFSHERSVFLQSRHSRVGWLNPPYRRWLVRLMSR
ncbi:coniferyl aldehyde dehydrogenase [Halomonas campisalis]|uniref:Aldehyde dehydrogenase n=1 Tax=Billgrantia campisalis TaxID=74661 RepID=A0ABS9PA10_9GAMM|nr:coniferyl aldehyde dehydrogenase [Halomonas campisalis]MCG6658087.1 coniferyl aldehyde dehydrogenase [Halomonas campisalis]MDR5862753.1 coniferyl aldehyde dehydrogenase [Halomonas campisalis]